MDLTVQARKAVRLERRHSQPVPRHLTAVKDVETWKVCCSLKGHSSVLMWEREPKSSFLILEKFETRTHNTHIVRGSGNGSRDLFPRQSS